MKSIWKGALSFGLIHIPVNLYSATKERELKFTMLHKKDLSPIRYARICKSEDKEIPFSEIVKAYKLDDEDGEYVVLSDEDFKNANVEKTKNIEIQEFTEEREIESIYYDKLYYLEPGKNAQKVYQLLRDALRKSKKVAIAKYVLRNHEKIAVIKPYQNMLILNQIRMPSEIVKADLNIGENNKIPEKEMAMALQLIDQLTEPFHPEKFHDTYVEDLKEIINKKAAGGKVTKKGTEPKPTKIHDIMSLLKQSLEHQPKKAPKKTAYKARRAS